MWRDDAYTYHDAALGYLHADGRAKALSAGPAAEQRATAADPRIAIAVEESPADSRVVLRVRRLDEQTRRMIDDMRSAGVVPDDVEVEEIGRLYAYGPADRVSPIQPGVACAHTIGEPGTLGCILRRGEERLLLSANHVLARENQASIGDDIVQPIAVAVDHRVIATLAEFEPLAAVGNRMDAAVAVLTVADVDARLFNGTRVSGVRTAPLLKGDRVIKFGQATEERIGSVLSMTSNVTLDMNFAAYAFDHQIEVESTGAAFSAGGDSGALVYDEDDLAVGIVIGGNGGQRSIVTPIGPLLTRFGGTLA